MHSPRATQPSFFFGDDDEEKKPQSARDLPYITTTAPSTAPTTASSTSHRPQVQTHLPKIAEVLLFPIENSHAYSYAHLSPNSLALRLNVLKRLLEILNDRPDWFKTMNEDTNNSDDEQNSLPKLASQPFEGAKKRPHNRLLLAKTLLRTDSSDHLDKFKARLNASSAALSAFFRPKISRADSLPASRNSFDESAEFAEESIQPADQILSDDLKDIIELLEKDLTIISHNLDIASTLHDLSLSSNEEDSKKKQNILKTKMLYALATPFVEIPNALASPWDLSVSPVSAVVGASPASNYSVNYASSAALSLLDTMQQPQAATASGNRPFHAISSGKHASPQSVVTVESEYPWNFKAANDLACLMFGVLKNTIRNLTLMDLIAPQFRNFVTERLSRISTSSLDRAKANKDIIFAGEIIAISRQAEGDFAWTSIWAKRRQGLVIFTFEQITCDAFDVVVLRDIATYPDLKYVITNVDEIAGKLITKLDASGITQLSVLSESLATDLNTEVENFSKISVDVHDSELINRKRYYTVQLNGDDNIPCALTSYPLEKDEGKLEVKIKIHLMPYIAGMFVVDFQTFNVLSCNKAIAKNLFGVSSDHIIDKSINNIIPGFTDILKRGLADQNEPTTIVPGLVLPEHFFRKYHAYTKHTSHDNISPDERFVKSRGIDGLHGDGKALYIDVQLRVILPDVFVLWVTYSRHTNKNISKQLGKLSSASSLNLKGSGNLLHKTRASSGSSSKVDLPSQLKLFPKNESELLECGSGSPDVSRHSSLRRPKKANTFAVPVTYIADPTFSQDDSLFSRSVSKRSASTSDQANVDDDLLVPPVSNGHRDSNAKHYEKFSEEEILAIENEELARQAENSKYWPSVIGAKKRSKKFDEFKVLKKMGEGAYGKVVLAEHKYDPAYKIMIKCIDKQRILVDTWVRDRRLGTIPSEIQVMATLNNEPHPNIMRIVDYFEDPNYYYLETPIFGNPPAIDLFDYIEVKKDMSELDCQLIFKQVVLAIYHLHKHGIVHRDIKDENIIVNEFGVIKLIDFGSAGYVKLGPFDVFVGTIDYASPEVLRGEKYEGKPQDIWALGILLYTMIYKENPFYNVDEIMEGDLRVPFIVSEPSLDLVRQILNREISERPTITDIADHDWLDI